MIKDLVKNADKKAVDAAIETYYRGLALGDISSLPLREVFIKCSRRAWKDAVLMGTGNIYGVGQDTVDGVDGMTEKDQALDHLVETGYLGFIFKPATDKAEFCDFHKKLCDEIIAKFPKYNARMESAVSGRKVGFTYGNAQKLINISLKDLYACLCVEGEKLKKANGPMLEYFFDNFEEFFKYCHMPFDSLIYDYFIAKEIRPVPDALKTVWSKQTDYASYMRAQDAVENYVHALNADVTVLRSEFVIWAECKRLDAARGK